MSGSDWGKRTPLVEWVLPTIGIVGAIALAMGVGYLMGLTPPDPPNTSQRRQYAAAKARYAQSVAGKFGDPKTDYATYPDEYSYKCYYAPNHETADLCAQWRASIAAEKSALWTFWAFFSAAVGTGISICGLGALIYTLRQTERSLKETRSANEIARDAADAQTRPFLVLDNDPEKSIEADGDDWIITFIWKNVGPTPAVFSEFNSYCRYIPPAQQVIDERDVGHDFPDDALFDDYIVIPSGCTHTTKITISSERILNTAPLNMFGFSPVSSGLLIATANYKSLVSASESRRSREVVFVTFWYGGDTPGFKIRGAQRERTLAKYT